MLWPSIVAIIIAIGLIRLGALSVWLIVFQSLLLAVLGGAICVGLVFLWRRYKRTDTQKRIGGN